MIETRILTVLLKVIVWRLVQTNTGLIRRVVGESSQYSLLRVGGMKYLIKIMMMVNEKAEVSSSTMMN